MNKGCCDAPECFHANDPTECCLRYPFCRCDDDDDDEDFDPDVDVIETYFDAVFHYMPEPRQ